MPEKARRNRSTLRTREHRALIDVIVASRKAARLRQEDLADRISERFGVKASRSWIAKFEAGERGLDAVELIWIESAVDLAPGMLTVRVTQWLETAPEQKDPGGRDKPSGA